MHCTLMYWTHTHYAVNLPLGANILGMSKCFSAMSKVVYCDCTVFDCPVFIPTAL